MPNPKFGLTLDNPSFRSGVLLNALQWSGSAVDAAIKLLAQGRTADAKAALEASLAETKGYLRQIEQADAKRGERLGAVVMEANARR